MLEQKRRPRAGTKDRGVDDVVRQSKPIKVLFLTGCSGSGGAGHSLFYLLRYLDPKRVEPLVVMPKDGAIGEKLRGRRIKTILAPRLRERFHELRFRRKNPVTQLLSYLRNSWDGTLFIFQLIGIVRRHDVDVIYCNHMMVKIMGVLAGLVTRRSVILHCRTIYENRAERFLYASLARLPHVKRIVAVSNAAAANFSAIAHKVRVVPNGVPHPTKNVAGTLRQTFGIADSTTVVAFVGRVVKWKGIDIFMAAAEEVLQVRNDIVFVIVGEAPVGSGNGTARDYQVQIRQKNLDKGILFTGFTPNIGTYLRDINVVVVPSISPDPCPRTVIEAMAFGIPIIGSATGGITETIIHDETGLLVEPGNVAEVRKQILRVLDDQPLRARLGSGAKQAARQRFSAEKVSKEIQQIIEETRNGRVPRG